MSYVPPHKRRAKNSASAPATSAPSTDQRNTQTPPRNGSHNHAPQNGSRQNQNRDGRTNSRFRNIFSGYDGRQQNYNHRGGHQGRNGGFGGYGGYHGRSQGHQRRGGRGGKAAMELSTQPNPILERELFGDQSDQMAQGINFDKYNDIPVEMSGTNAPSEIDHFKNADFPEALLSNITRCGFSIPTPIQKFAIPIVTLRRDLMACAQTGSGKTAAFLFPVINNLLKLESCAPDIHQRRSSYYPRSLVLSPTRELSQQIHVQARKFLYCTGMRAVCIYGGSPIGEQFRELDGGVHILVATPGRLFDMIERGRVSLSKCEYLTLDEADRMLDMGFEPQIRNIVENSDMIKSSEGRNTLMFSATFPEEIQQLAQDFLQDYIFVAVGRVGSTTDLIVQQLRHVQERDKLDELFNILPGCEGLKLVFTATKREADRVEMELQHDGIRALAIHGDKSQREREYALRSFRKGKIDTLVATDVAARGLDIPNVLWVIQYDLPSTIDDYVHRIGRTGRCGNTGTAISFVNSKNNNVIRSLQELLEESKQEIPSWFVQMVNNSYRGKRGKRNGRYGGRDFRKGQTYYNKGRRQNNNNYNNNRRPRDDHW